MPNPKNTKAQEKLYEDPDASVELEDLSEQQQKGILNWEMGMSWHQALLKAGYSESYACHPRQFRNSPAVAAYFRGASKQVRKRLTGDILERAAYRIERGLSQGKVDSGIVSLIKIVLKYAGLEPPSKQKIEQTVTEQNGGSDIDLSALYDVLPEEQAERVLRAIQAGNDNRQDE